jgi:Snf7
MYEAQLAQLTQQTFNIESTALATENLRNTMVTLDAMSQANKELRKQYGKIDIGKIEVRAISSGEDKSSSSSRLIGIVRICNTTWRSFWSRRTRSKSR